MNFDKAIEYVLKHEGGYIDNSKDRGGITNMGISQRAYPDEDIKNLTKERAKEIYYNDYWCRGKCELLPEELKFPHLSFCVNMGVFGANKLLQEACGSSVDGVVGAETLNAALTLTKEKYCFYAAKRYGRIVVANPSQLIFLNGWMNRLEEIINA